MGGLIYDFITNYIIEIVNGQGLLCDMQVLLSSEALHEQIKWGGLYI